MNENTGHDAEDATGADYFTTHAGIALDDARDPIEGFDAAMLADLARAAATFSREVRTLHMRSERPSLPELGEATRLVAERMRADMADYVGSAVNEVCNIAQYETEWKGTIEAAETAADEAAELVFDEAVSMAHWALRGMGGTDWCHDADEREDDVNGERNMERAREHGLLMISGAAYVAALTALRGPVVTES